jgi:hypothetical protein
LAGHSKIKFPAYSSTAQSKPADAELVGIFGRKLMYLDVDVGFVVGLATLREVLKGLREDGKQWWIASEPQDAMEGGALLIGYGDPRCDDLLNRIIVSVPALDLNEVPKHRTDGIVLLIEPSSMSVEEPGLYRVKNGLVQGDFIEDFERFWRPIKRALIDRLIAAGEPWEEYESHARL